MLKASGRMSRFFKGNF